jgi:TRAP-type C4-dicarboxylate transport system substrate-binding protein
MRLGGSKPRRQTAGERLYEVLGEQLAPLDLQHRLQLGGALMDRDPWANLDPWVRDIFEAAATKAASGG